MQKRMLWPALVLALLAVRLGAAERSFDFNEAPTNQPPPGCVAAVGGEGKPGGWMVLLDAVPEESNAFTITSTDSSNLMAPASGPHMTLKSVVGQVAHDTTDNHYPMLMLGDQSYGDFTFTTKFKIAGGDVEQIAGVAFRVQDEKNYYVARANVKSGTFYFYKVEKGMHAPPFGNNVKFKTGDWHELTVQCLGTEIRLKLDGKDAMPALNDPTFAAGRIALWTKSDSVAYFRDMAVTYTPKVNLAQQVVDDAMEEYPRLLGLQVFVAAPAPAGTKMIASADGKGIGDAGEAADADVIKRGVYYLKRGPDMVVVTMPLNDRNGDPMAAVRVMLRPVPGQTEENARIRALPIIKTMQKRLAAVHSLTD
jgi:hypothetical protein